MCVSVWRGGWGGRRWSTGYSELSATMKQKWWQREQKGEEGGRGRGREGGRDERRKGGREGGKKGGKEGGREGDGEELERKRRREGEREME